MISVGTVLIIDYWWNGAGILNGDPLQALVNNAAISPKDADGGRLGCAATPLDTWRTAPVKLPYIVGFCTPS